MTEKRRVYTAEFKREAVRLVTDHGYGGRKRLVTWESMSRCWGAGSAKPSNRPMVAWAATGRWPPKMKTSCGCARRASVCAWSGRFSKSHGLLCQRVELRYAS